MSEIVEREITQGIIPIGTPKAYQYDTALVETAKATVLQGITEVVAQETVSKNNITNLGNTIIDQIEHGYGYPFTASSGASMTDQTKIYVYVGTTDSSFTNGHWYYYNGSAWTDGGIYNSTAFTTDTTLTISGSPADAKTVGDYVFYALTLKTALRTSIPTNSDFDDYTTAGNYKVQTSTIMQTLFNRPPTTRAGFLFVFTGSDGSQWVQIYFAQVSSQVVVYIREKLGSSGNWTSWDRFVYASELDFIANDGDSWEEV